VPNAVFCLLSALRIHNLTTQNPNAIWLAIPSRARTPRLETPRLEIVRQSGAAWHEGVEDHVITLGDARISLKVTTPAKTIADCFKFRSRVGLDVALEALRDSLQRRMVTQEELWHFAEVDRVSTVMRPYLEAMSV
jgi:predicted transcriptional regulator of viral defense system